MKNGFIIFSLIACVIIVSCSHDINRNSEVITEEEKMSVSVDEVFKIELDVQMGTGFSWMIRSSDGFKIISRPKIESRNQNEPQPGKNEKMIFEFKAIEAGTRKIVFEYRQKWRKDGPAGKTRTVIVEVKQ